MANLSMYQEAQPVKINSPYENAAMLSQIQQGQNQNKLSQMAFAEKDRQDSERNALAGIAKQYGNTPEYGNQLYKGGFAKEAQEQQKYQLEQAKVAREAEKAKIEAGLQQFEAIGQIMGGVNDQTSYDAAKQQIVQILGPEAAANMPPAYDPAIIAQGYQKALSVKDQMTQRRQELNDMILPDGSVNKTLLGAKAQIAQAGASSIQNFGSPVSAIDPATGKPVLIQTGNRGGVNVLPYDPAPKEAKPFTEAENNATGYLGRMQAAEKTLGGLQGGELTEGTALAGAVPFVGDYAQRKAMNPTQQKYKQAADDWIRAKLRKESGAVIGADESAAEYRTYFPQPGDGAGVIAQKAQARKQAEAQIMQSAGRAGVDYQAKDDARYKQKPFNPEEMAYIQAQKARGVPESEIIRGLNAGKQKKPAPAKAGSVKFLGFE